MLGTFQQSQLRIGMAASASDLSRALLHTQQLRCWLLPQLIPDELPPELVPGVTFTSWIGPVPVEHKVESVGETSICFSLSRAVDGVHDWSWGEGWVQSRLEGISWVPLHVGNIATLLRLKTYLAIQGQVRSPQS
ncbi:MAG: hypothetical protein HC852_19120 [Acaryochloridaceae cyanobacterium RU_4_10]|nr:hypothetical protein [Acaryochloridaceae cyanobacterium RU_4_10]